MTEKPSNPLNIHLALTQAFTRKEGEDYRKTIATIETNLPNGIDALTGLNQLKGTLAAFFSESDSSRPQPQPVSTDPKEKPKPALDPVELDRLEWKAYREGHSAGWIFADKVPRTLVETLEKGPTTIGQFTYNYSGPEEKPKLFVSRTPGKEKR